MTKEKVIKSKKIRIKGVNKVFEQLDPKKQPTAVFNFPGFGVGGATAKIELLAPTKTWLNWFNKNKDILSNWYQKTFNVKPKNTEELKKQVLFETQRVGKKALADEEEKVYAVHPTKAEARDIFNKGIEKLSQSSAFIGESKYKLHQLAKLIKSKNWLAPGEVINWANGNFRGFHYVDNTSTEWYIEDMIGYARKGEGYHEYLLMFDFSNLIIQLVQTR